MMDVSTANHVMEPSTTTLYMASTLEKKFGWMERRASLFGDSGTRPLVLTVTKGATMKSLAETVKERARPWMDFLL